MLFKMCHHAGLNELRRFSDGTSELFESRVDLIACLNAQLLKALILVLQKLQGLLLLTFNVDVRGTWYEVRECQDFCVWGGYSRGSPTRLPFVFEMQYARPDAIAGAKVEGPARSAGGSSLAPAIARREAAGALAREV